MTADPVFAQRIVRLAITSGLVLPLIWFLAATTLDTHLVIRASLGGGWILMPSILGLSLKSPRLRYGLIVPSALVSVALLGICGTALPEDKLASLGWLLVTGGILFGGVLGMWFWFRWAPVPSALVEPFSRGRWALIGVHISLIVAGLVLVGLAATTLTR
jgi:hypothetical protein